MQFYAKNQYSILANELLDKSNKEQLRHRLTDKYQPKKFSTRWQSLRIASLWTSYLSNLLSLLSGTFAIGTFIYLQVGQLLPYGLGLSVLLATFLAALLETFKRHSSSNYLQAAFQYQRWKSLNLLSMLLLTGLSIGLSFYGANKVPIMTNPNPTLLVTNLEDVEAIRSDYDNQISNKNAQIKEKQTQITTFIANNQSQRTGQLSSAKSVRTGHKKLNEELAALEKDLSTLQSTKNQLIIDAQNRNRTATEQTDQQNAALLITHEQDMESYGSTLAYFSILFEMIFILSILFCEFYDYRSYIEECAVDDFLAENEQPHAVNNNDNKSGNSGNKREVVTNDRVQLIQHTNKDGELREYKKSQVQYFIRQYQERIQDYLQEGKKGLVERNKQVLEYWQNRLREFT